MQPVYVTVTPSGSSPWKLTNWHATGLMNIGFGVKTSGLTSTWQVDVTMDDPTNVFPSSAGPDRVSVVADRQLAERHLGRRQQQRDRQHPDADRRLAGHQQLDRRHRDRDHGSGGHRVMSFPEADTIQQAREALGRLREAERTSWADWLLIGRALLIARRDCMLEAKANSPFGWRYNQAMGAWLRTNGLDGVSGQDRHKLLECLAHEIEAWRTTLTDLRPILERQRGGRIPVPRDWRGRRCRCPGHPVMCRYGMAGQAESHGAGRLDNLGRDVRLCRHVRHRLRLGEHQ